MRNIVFLSFSVFASVLVTSTELFAQMGANIVLSDSEFEGGFSNAYDGLLSFISVVVLFGGPFIITRNIEYGEQAGFAYWKWWFFVLIVSSVGVAVGSYVGGLIASLGATIYGIVKEWD